MAYRIDGGARHRFLEDSDRSEAIPKVESAAFLNQIETVSRQRQDGGNRESGQPEIGERVFVVEAGDTMEGIARNNNADVSETLAINANETNRNGDLIHPGDILILPAPDPELVAGDVAEEPANPAADDDFITSLHERGNAVEYAEPEDGVDTDAEINAMQEDVSVYLGSLPPELRQEAASRLSSEDWIDSGPAGIAVSRAIENAGLETNPLTAFTNELRERGNALEYPDEGVTIDQSQETQKLADDINLHLEGLPEAERAEALQELYDNDWTDAGPAQIAIENAAENSGIKLLPTGHNGPEAEKQARHIVSSAEAAGGEHEARMEAFVAGYETAPADVQKALLGLGSADFLAGVADYATTPLQTQGANGLDGGAIAESLGRLDRLTADAPPEVAAALVSKAAPELDKTLLAHEQQTGIRLPGPQSAGHVQNIADRLEGSPRGEAILEGWAASGLYVRDSVRESVGRGNSLTYAAELDEQGGMDSILTEEVLPGVGQNQQRVTDLVDEYSSELEELQWLISNHGETMTPEQLSEAIEDYKSEKGDEWKANVERLEAAVATEGETLLEQITQLSSYPGATDQEKELIQDKIDAVMEDDRAYLAIQAALGQSPEILEQPETIDFLAGQARLTDRGRKLAEESVTQILRHNVLPTLETYVPGDEAKLADVKKGLESFRDGRTAKLLGVTEADMNKAIDAIEKALPQDGDTDAVRDAKLKTLNARLNEIDSPKPDGIRSFSASSAPGQLLRFLGATASAVGTANSISRAGGEPNELNLLKASLDSAGLGQRSVELLGGFDKIDPDSFLGKNFRSSVQPGTKILGVATGLLDVGLGVRTAVDGNVPLGTSQALTGGAAIMASAGSGTILGPIGLALTITGVAVTMSIENAQHNSRFETETSREFLAHSGLDAEATQVLIDQSGESHSPVPILVEYAKLKGYDMTDPADRATVIDWINAMPPEQAATLRDNLHHTLDEFDGDASKLSLTATGDHEFTNEEAYNKMVQNSSYDIEMGPRWSVVTGDQPLDSVTKIDVALETLNLQPLATA